MPRKHDSSSTEEFVERNPEGQGRFGAIRILLPAITMRSARVRCFRHAAIYLRLQSVPHSVLARKNALHDLADSPMVRRGKRCCGGFGVRGGNISEKIASVLFADHFQLRQSKQQRFTDAKGSHAVGRVQAYMFGHVIFLSDTNLILSPRCRTDADWSMDGGDAALGERHQVVRVPTAARISQVGGTRRWKISPTLYGRGL